MLTTQQVEVKEGNTLVIETSLMAIGGGGVSAASLNTLVMTLFDLKSGAIINSRQSVDILNQNGCTINESGVLTINLDAEDNIALHSAPAEVHALLLEWETVAGHNGADIIEIVVHNLGKVGNA